MTNSSRYDLARIEAKIDIITNLLLRNHGISASDTTPTSEGVNSAELALVRSFTAKQHVAAQLIMQGWMNRDIATVLNVGENTVKLHVRAVCKKIGTKTRGQAAIILRDIFERMDPNEYMRASGGIPIDWAATYDASVPDNYAPIYRTETE